MVSLTNSKILEQLFALVSKPSNPLISFPPNLNSNVYADIVNFAIENAPDVIKLITSISVKFESPVLKEDIIKIATIFSYLANAANENNNSLKKSKSIAIRSSGLTNSGLDALSAIGFSETSRSHRNNRDYMASLSEGVLKNYAKSSVPQFTFDNLDFNMNSMNHHMTLNILEFEQSVTSHLDTRATSLDDMLMFFKQVCCTLLCLVLTTYGLSVSLFVCPPVK